MPTPVGVVVPTSLKSVRKALMTLSLTPLLSVMAPVWARRVTT